MKKLLRFFSSALTFALVMTMMTSAFAFGLDPTMPGSGDAGYSDMKGAIETILGFIAFMAWAVALIMILVIGIKYMTRGAGGRAEVKSTFLPYVIGAVCVGSATTIATFVMGIGAEAQ